MISLVFNNFAHRQKDAEAFIPQITGKKKPLVRVAFSLMLGVGNAKPCCGLGASLSSTRFSTQIGAPSLGVLY